MGTSQGEADCIKAWWRLASARHQRNVWSSTLGVWVRYTTREGTRLGGPGCGHEKHRGELRSLRGSPVPPVPRVVHPAGSKKDIQWRTVSVGQGHQVYIAAVAISPCLGCAFEIASAAIVQQIFRAALQQHDGLQDVLMRAPPGHARPCALHDPSSCTAPPPAIHLLCQPASPPAPSSCSMPPP